MSGTTDYTTAFGANRLKEELESQIRMLGMPYQTVLDTLFTRKKGTFKGKRLGTVHMGTAEMSKQTDMKGKVNQGHLEAIKTYIELCSADLELCFDYDEMQNGEADIIGPAVTRMREARDLFFDQEALNAMFGSILMGDPCKLKEYKEICHIPHEGFGLTPQKVIAASEAISAFYPNAQVCVGITNTQSHQMTQYPEWTNNDFLYSGAKNAYSGMVQTWHNTTFKLMPDFWEQKDLQNDPFGTLKPVIPAVPCIEGGTWDGETFIRFLPVWIKQAMDYAEGYGPTITPIPDKWKYASLAYKVYFIRIDDRLGFRSNNERGRAVICVKEKSKHLSEAYAKNPSAFGAPDGIIA